MCLSWYVDALFHNDMANMCLWCHCSRHSNVFIFVMRFSNENKMFPSLLLDFGKVYIKVSCMIEWLSLYQCDLFIYIDLMLLLFYICNIINNDMGCGCEMCHHSLAIFLICAAWTEHEVSHRFDEFMTCMRHILATNKNKENNKIMAMAYDWTYNEKESCLNVPK